MKEKYFGIFLNIVLIAYSIIHQEVILKYHIGYSEEISVIVILLCAILSILFFGYKKMYKTPLTQDVKYKTIIVVAVYFLITYSIGLLGSFEKNYYSIYLFFHNLLPPLITIIAIEIYRYVVVSTRSKSEIVLTTIALIIFEVCISMKFSYLLTIKGLFKYSTLVIIPIVMKNLVMNYLAKYGGIKATLIYRISLETYIYIVPIIPKLSDYMNSMFRICLPIIAFVYISKAVDNYNNANKKVKLAKEKISIVNSILLLMLITLIMLVSGIFTFSVIGVGSNSMLPTIEKGDAVIYKQIKNEKELKTGDILVYQDHRNKKIIIHRLVKIEKKGKNKKKKVYITKGDANKSNDHLELTYKDIKGKVVLKIKYLARPTMFFQELLG